MKLILYHANAMMKEIAENWAKENQIEVTVLSELLTAESVKLAKDMMASSTLKLQVLSIKKFIAHYAIMVFARLL